MSVMHSKKSLRISAACRLFLLLLGAAFLAVGVYRAETETVMMKAVYICLECIGIG